MTTPHPQHVAGTLGESSSFPSVPEDAPEELDGPSVRREEALATSPEDNAATGRLAYAVHTDQLVSTRGRRVSALQSNLDEVTVALIQAALSLTSSLRVPDALCRLAESVCSTMGVSRGTIAVFNHADMDVDPADPLSPDPSGASSGTGLCSGVSTATFDEFAQMAGAPDTAGTPCVSSESLLSGLEGTGMTIDNDLGRASAFIGVIEDEETGSLFSAPLHLHGQAYGHLYLCDKPGSFTRSDVDATLALVQVATAAAENARLYRKARDREQWMMVSQKPTTLLFLGTEEDNALTPIAHRVHQVVYADTAALILPSIGERWTCEIADGEHARGLTGISFPPEGRALTTLAYQIGLIVDSLEDAWGSSDLVVPQLAQLGPVLCAPMICWGRGVGVMLLLRSPGVALFIAQDLEIAELMAGQATMAFELVDAQHAEEMAASPDERARIGRDLRDLTVQQLFAIGMQISTAWERLAPSTQADLDVVCSVLSAVLEAVDDSVGQIRPIMCPLCDCDEEVGVIEWLRREASLACSALDYAPLLPLSVDGRGLAQVDRDEEGRFIASVGVAVAPDIADGMVAVVREGLSNVVRHAHASSATVDIKIEGVQPGSGQHCGPGNDEDHASGDIEPFRGSPMVEIVYRDDSVGVNPLVTRRLEMANMAERACCHGGSLVISPRARPDGEWRGTCFTWRVPLDGGGRVR